MAKLTAEQLAAISDNWGATLEEDACVATQTLSQLTDEALACRSSSSHGGTDEGAGGTPLAATSPSWALRIAKMTASKVPGKLKSPLNVISGCTGISAESFVLKAILAQIHLSH